MGEVEFIDKEIVVDERVANILGIIEEKIIKYALDNFAEREDEIRELGKFVEQIDALRGIYTQEQKEFQSYKKKLEGEGISSILTNKVNSDLTKMIVDLNEYEKMLEYIKIKIESREERLKDSKNRSTIKDISEDIHNKFYKFYAENADAIKTLRSIKYSLKNSN